jgi:putative transposase
MPPTIRISDLMRIVKINSSKWINERRFVKGKFQWQDGYGAFSHSRSHRDKVIKYVMNQELHHKTITFRNEYLTLLENFGVTFDMKYVFEFYE